MRKWSDVVIDADVQVIPRYTIHNPDEKSGFIWVHLDREEGQGAGRTLRDLLPELFPDGAGHNRHLFGCADCDIILQVSVHAKVHLIVRSYEP